MKNKKNRSPFSGRTQALLLAGALIAMACSSEAPAPDVAAPTQPFTYVHVIGTGDPVPDDPHMPPVPMDPTIAACDVGSLTNFGLMSNVCSFDGDPNSNGGVYHPVGGAPYRSFRREDPLPGQNVGFEKAVIPFGYPALHPTTGDTYLTAFFDRLPGEDTGHSNRPGGRQVGVYVYRYKGDVMEVIADTTTGSEPLPENAVWTDFSTNVAVSEAGAFFVGDYKIAGDDTGRQGIYQFVDGKLLEIVGNPATTEIPGTKSTFSKYRAVAANTDTALFVGESMACATEPSDSCPKGLYAYRPGAGTLSTVLESGTSVPGGGTFLDFAVEPEEGIFHSSIATNKAGDIVLVAGYEKEGVTYQGVFLLKKSGSDYIPTLLLSSGGPRFGLLESDIQSFNTVAINDRSEVAFVVANNRNRVPEQGLVFYRNPEEGLLSVFKQGDSFLADLKHPSEKYQTTGHGGLVSGSQALDSSEPPRIFFRHFYKVVEGQAEKTYSMMVLATLKK